eukprot:scaffold2754_cov149-Skeletonema_menzelii.AAC.10
MIERHERYKERVGESDIRKNSGYARTSPHDADWILEDADDEEIGYDDDYIGSNSSYQKWMNESWPSSTPDGEANRHWFEPRPDELRAPNTINYNSFGESILVQTCLIPNLALIDVPTKKGNDP